MTEQQETLQRWTIAVQELRKVLLQPLSPDAKREIESRVRGLELGISALRSWMRRSNQIRKDGV